MSTADRMSQKVRELSVEECLNLLASVAVGRIAYDDAQGPVVIPVNHVVDAGTVVLRTSPASSLAGLVGGGPASFQVDDVDDRGRESWSVLLRGTVHPLDPDEVLALRERPEPQAEGIRSLYLRLTPRSITGRRLLPSR